MHKTLKKYLPLAIFTIAAFVTLTSSPPAYAYKITVNFTEQYIGTMDILCPSWLLGTPASQRDLHRSFNRYDKTITVETGLRCINGITINAKSGSSYVDNPMLKKHHIPLFFMFFCGDITVDYPKDFEDIFFLP